MAFEKRKARHDWRSKLTADEAKEVAKLEKRIAELRGKLAGPIATLGPIRNRAIQRCKLIEDRK